MFGEVTKIRMSVVRWRDVKRQTGDKEKTDLLEQLYKFIMQEGVKMKRGGRA